MNLSPRSFAIAGLILLLSAPVYAQRIVNEDHNLLIYVIDFIVEQVLPEGFHLYIRKKPSVESVLLTHRNWRTVYCAGEWNEVNGDEVRFVEGRAVPTESASGDIRYPLIDSTAEPYADLGEFFHIYIPATLYYDNLNGSTQAYSPDGLYINVQTFTLPYGDSEGMGQNNPFRMQLNPKTPLTEDTVTESVEPETEETSAEAVSEEPDPSEVAEPEEISEETPAERVARMFMPELRARLGFMLFSPGAGRVLNEERSLDNKYDINGELELKQRFSDLVSIRLGFERDSVLMNRLFARGQFDFSLLSLTAGVFFGILNQTEDALPSGASLSLSAQLFDFVAAFRIDIPLGNTLPSSYAQSYTAFNLDWFPSWAHLGLSLIGRSLFQKTAGDLDFTSKWVQYALFGEKGFGRFTPRLELGYQELSWIFLMGDTAAPAEYHYASIYLGLGTAFSLTSALSLNIHLQVPVYPFVYVDILNAPFFFNASLGVSWNLNG
jgi:hypothetical protein